MQFVYNALGRHYRAIGDLELTPGAHEFGASFEREGRSGRLALTVDGREIGSTKVETIVRMPGSTGVDVGRNGLSPLVDDYEPPFAFTGRIRRITFDIKGRPGPSDVQATTRAEMGKE